MKNDTMIMAYGSGSVIGLQLLQLFGAPGMIRGMIHNPDIHQTPTWGSRDIRHANPGSSRDGPLLHLGKKVKPRANSGSGDQLTQLIQRLLMTLGRIFWFFHRENMDEYGLS